MIWSPKCLWIRCLPFPSGPQTRHTNTQLLLDFYPPPPLRPRPHFSQTVILHLSLFAWRNAKHNEVQAQTQTPLPIPVHLTHRDSETAWRHPHRQTSAFAGKRRLTGDHNTPPGTVTWLSDQYTPCVCCIKTSLCLSLCLSPSVFALFLPFPQMLFLWLYHSLVLFII